MKGTGTAAAAGAGAAAAAGTAAGAGAWARNAPRQCSLILYIHAPVRISYVHVRMCITLQDPGT